MATTPRDPRTDPRPGDVVWKVRRGKRVERTVVYRSAWGTVIYDVWRGVGRDGKTSAQLRCTLKVWKRWSKDAGVGRTFDGFEPIHKCMLTLMPRSAEDQVRGLANQFLDEGHRNPYPGRPFSTPFDDMAQMIFDFGLHMVVSEWSAKHDLFETLRARLRERDGKTRTDSDGDA